MIRTLPAATAAALLAVFGAGCNQSPPGGTTPSKATGETTSAGTHATTKTETTVTGHTSRSGTFSLTAPTLSTTIKQGDRKTIDLTLDRGSDFKQGVKLTAEAPKGVKAELSKSTLAAGDDKKFSLTVSVDKDAPVGDSPIKVTGTPDTGSATSVEVKVKVDKGS